MVAIARIQHIARSIEIEGEGWSGSDSEDTTHSKIDRDRRRRVME